MQNKVGFFCGSLSNGGLERNLVHLANAMATHPGQYIFFLPAKAPYRNLVNEARITLVEIPLHRKYLDFRKAVGYAALFKKTGIQQLIFRDTKDLDVLVWAKKRFASLELVYWQAMQLGVSKKGFYHTFKFNQLTKWVASLETLKSQALNQTSIKSEKLAVIPVGVNLTRFKECKITKEEAREQLTLPQQEKIIGIIGRIDPQKGQRFVIEQLVNFPQVHLVIVGEATTGEHHEFEKELKQLPAKLGIEDRVHFRPFLAESEVFYKAVDVCVMASDAETFGAVTIEAMASGTPVLGTDSGGTPEILEQGKLGTLYKPHNIDSFKTSLTELFYSLEEKKEIAKVAQQQVAQRYDWKNVADSFRSLLNNMNQ